MPSKSAKQHRFMEAVAHGMKPRKGGPSQAVAKEFAAADKGRDFRGMKNGRKDNGPDDDGDHEFRGEAARVADREVNAMNDQVNRRSNRIKARRNRS